MAQWDDQNMKDAEVMSSTWKEHPEQIEVLSSTASFGKKGALMQKIRKGATVGMQ